MSVPLLGSGRGTGIGTGGPGGGGGPSFPAGITTLIGRWDASVTASMTLSGANITNIADQSGAGNHLGNGSASNKPQYNATGFNTSYPTMEFTSGSSQLLQSTSTFNLGTGNTVTVFAALTLLSGAASFAHWLSYVKGGGTNDYDNVGSFSAGRPSSGFSGFCLTRNGVDSPIVTSGTAYATPIRVIGTFDSGGVMRIYIDGVLTTGATSGGNWVSGGQLALGGHVGGGLLHWSGAISEAGIATQYCDATLAGELDAYLEAKWGL
jgi:hypothetical protein